MLLFNFNNWQFWDAYDPPNGTFGEQKVGFDGPNKVIYVAEGVTELDVQQDLYSAWKEWIIGTKEFPHASAYLNAFSVVGGDPITDTQSLGSTYFLENGWRIQPFPSDSPYVLTVNGNIYTREAGGNPFLFAQGVAVSLTRSNIIDLITVSGVNASITVGDLENIRDYVWDKALADINSTNTTGDKLKKDLTKTQYLALK